MNKRRKFSHIAIAALLAAIMLFMAACGGSGQQQATTAAEATTAAAAATTAAAAATEAATTTAAGAAATTATAAAATTTAAVAATTQAEAGGEATAAVDMLNEPWETPYPETITISTANREQPTAIFPDGGDPDDNIWLDLIRDRLNIQIVNDFVSAEYTTSMNLAIAAQSLPDVFYVTNPQYKQVVDAGLVADITEIYDKLASDTLREFNASDITVLDAARVGGRLFGQPRLGWGNNIDRPPFVWIRHDWMVEQGLSEPQSIDELKDIIRLFNDVYGTKGMAVEKTLGYLLLIAPSWHAYPKIWVDTPEGIGYGGVQPEMKAVLQEWAQWYAEGLIAPEFAAKDEIAMNQDVINNMHGVQPYWQWAGWRYADVVRNNTTDSWLEPFLLPTIDGRQQMVPIQFDNGNEVLVVNKSCQHPEALIKLIDMYIYINNIAFKAENMEMSDYQKYTNNDMQHYPSFRVNNPLSEYQQYLEVQNVLANNRDVSLFTEPVAFVKYESAILWIDNADPAGLGAAFQVGLPDISAYAKAEPYHLNGWFLRSKMWGPTPEILLRYGTTLDDLLIEGYTKIIMGVEPIDYFDRMIEEWKTAGGAEVTDAVNVEFGG
ncbi:MAG: hypothetical protein FWH01_14005 [Oscillospiraceae bacterium]|nr:hypothetical protein [Oscillospiraceae bacterium]